MRKNTSILPKQITEILPVEIDVKNATEAAAQKKPKSDCETDTLHTVAFLTD